MEQKLKIAVFIDFDNIEIGVKSTLHREFDVAAVLDALKERGEIVTKFAYANWGRQESATRALSEHAVQMVQRDPSPRGDKNGADINLALDALEMAFTHDHINAYAIVSGDSDFIALVNKLKQYDKRIFVVGGRAFTSTILQKNCHEFVAYESVMDDRPRSSGHQQHAAAAGAAPAAAPAAAAAPSAPKNSSSRNSSSSVRRTSAWRSIWRRPCRWWSALSASSNAAKCGRSLACSRAPCCNSIPPSTRRPTAPIPSPISWRSCRKPITSRSPAAKAAT